jgi:acyl-CoA thioesterase I
MSQILVKAAIAVTVAILSGAIFMKLFSLNRDKVITDKQTPVNIEVVSSHELPPILKDTKRIVMLGDSITEKGGNPGGYVWFLQRYFNILYPDRKIEIINAGISGNKSTDMAGRFQRDVLDKKPDLITINVGVNDVWHGFYDFKNNQKHPLGDLPGGVTLPLYREKLISMILAAQKAGIRVVLLSPTPIYEDPDNLENRRLTQYIEVMGKVASQHNCLFINLNMPLTEVIAVYQKHAGMMQNVVTYDGVHLNKIGNRIIAYTILRSLGIPDEDIKKLQV